MTGDPGEGEPSRVAIVTGGAGGIGAAVVRRLALDGYRVAVADLDLTAAAEVAKVVDGLAVAVDVTDLDANRAMVSTVLDRYGRLDLLVLNAGVNSGIRGGDPLDLARYRRATVVNVDGVVFGLDAARPPLSERGGAVVALSSLAALAPAASNPIYTLTKSAPEAVADAVTVVLESGGTGQA